MKSNIINGVSLVLVIVAITGTAMADKFEANKHQSTFYLGISIGVLIGYSLARMLINYLK